MKKFFVEIIRYILILIYLITLLFRLPRIIINRKKMSLKSKINSKNGIQQSEYIPLGNIQQFIRTRGWNKDNPVILFLHGGPALPMSEMACFWQLELEKEYTIVHWDQRGCGKTYFKNKKAEKPTIELLLSDLDELVDYLRKVYQQDKIILMGHSWGTMLGCYYIEKHPEKIKTYVGLGQCVDFIQGIKEGAEKARVSAFVKGKDSDAKKLEEYREEISTEKEYELKEFDLFKKIEVMLSNYLKNPKTSIEAWESPDFNWTDFIWAVKVLKVRNEMNDNLVLSVVNKKVDQLHYKTPMIFIMGKLDWRTSYDVAQDYYEKIDAPYKKWISMEDTGHTPFIEKPTEFSKLVMEELRKVN